MPFELVDERGRGGTGVVHGMRDLTPSEIVALLQLFTNVEFPEHEVELAVRDPATGDTRALHSTQWRPAAFIIVGDRLYAFTTDGLAYAIRISP